jgi:signal transduction histidine kinase
MYYLQKADSIGLVTNNFRFLPYIYLRMGNYSLKYYDDYSKAKNYYLKGLFYEHKIGDVAYVHDLLSKLSDIFIKNGPIDSAIYFINQSMLTAKKLGLRNVIQENYYKLYSVYNSVHNVDSALFYHELNAQLKDSLYNESISKNNSEANAKYETEKKEAQIIKQKLKIELEEKRRNRIIFGGIALLLLVGIAFQWLVNRQKRKNKETELVLKLKNKETELALKLKKAETQNLMELNNAKSKFFANITHEFRTPLTLIMGPLQDVIGKIKGDNKETLKIAHSNSKRLLTLVNDILELSTLEEGSPELNTSKACLFDFTKRGHCTFS